MRRRDSTSAATRKQIVIANEERGHATHHRERAAAANTRSTRATRPGARRKRRHGHNKLFVELECSKIRKKTLVQFNDFDFRNAPDDPEQRCSLMLCFLCLSSCVALCLLLSFRLDSPSWIEFSAVPSASCCRCD